MSTALLPQPQAALRMPDHNDLPETDGSIVINFNEAPQTRLLTESIEPILHELHPDGHYAIGQDSGIYFRLTNPPLDGCRAPDWFYVPNVPPMAPGGESRRSYVMWQEIIAPLLIVEYVSGDGSEERDRTPNRGKFWIYEQAIRAGYYAIHDHFRGTLEVHELVGGSFRPVPPNARDHFPIPPLRVELGKWVGMVGNNSGVWARFFDLNGVLLPADFERADAAELQAEQERQRAAGAASRMAQAEAEVQRLRGLLQQAGINPNPS